MNLVLSESSEIQHEILFWHKPTSDPPSSWDSWIGQFNLAITLREICDPRELSKPPGVVHDDPVPKPEAVGVSQDAL